MARTGWIYGLHCGDGVIRYIGQTVVGVESRISSHRSNARLGLSFPVYHWIRKHGVENLRYETLTECDESDLDTLEISMIAEARLVVDLLNVTDGGGGMRGFTHSEEAIEKMRKSHTGQLVGPRNGRYGIPMSPEAKEKMSAKKRGIKWTEARRRAQPAIRGSDVGTSKLKASDVLEIRRLHRSGVPPREISEIFGVHRTCVYKIVNRESWRWLEDGESAI